MTIKPVEDQGTVPLREDIARAIAPAYAIRAMLMGADALLAEFTGPDREGTVWAAREIVQQAMEKTEHIYGLADELGLFEHADELEAGYAGKAPV